MIRRNALALMAAAAAAPSFGQMRPNASAGAGGSDTMSTKPYDILEKPIAADRKRVRLLFTYDCPFCLRYHNGLVNWGASLPSSLAFDAFPVITNGDNENLVAAVIGRTIGQAVAPKVLPAFDFSMYTAIQGDAENNVPAKEKLTIDDVLKALVIAGAKAKDIQQFVRTKGKAIEAGLPRHVEIIKTYKLTATPSVAIGGRYVINPDHTQGNPQNLLLLLNGVVSRVVQGDTHAL